MSMSAADPRVLPTTNPNDAKHIARPNQLGPIAASTWERIPIHFPSIIVITTASAATVIAVPDRPNTDSIAQAEVYQAIPIDGTATTFRYMFYLPATGGWQIRSDVDITSAVIKDAHDGILPILNKLSAVGISGGVSGLTADVRDDDAEADNAKALRGLLVNARIAYRDLSTNDFVRAMGTAGSNTGGAGTVNDWTIQRLFVDALLRAHDSDLANTSAAVGVEAKAGVSTLATTVERLVVDSVLRGLNSAGNAFNVIKADTAAAAAQDETQPWLRVQAMLRAIDGSAGSGSRSVGVEARSTSGSGGSVTTGLNHLHTLAYGYGFDPINSALSPIEALREISTAGGAGLGTYMMRESGYWGGLRDRRFTITRAPGAVVVGQATYAATDPSVLLVLPATNEGILRRVWARLAEDSTAVVKATLVLDPDNRYSSGGTSFIPTGNFKSSNRGGSGTVAPTRAVYNDGITAIVATAEDNDEYYFGDKTFLCRAVNVAPAGAEVSWEIGDHALQPPSGSLLLTVFGEAIDFTFGMEFESANVQ